MTAPTADALEILRRDHRALDQMFQAFDRTEDPTEQQQLCEQIAAALAQHTEIEERVVYPFLRDATGREDLYEEAVIEHLSARNLLELLPGQPLGTPRLKAIVTVLGETVRHHVEEEESELFPALQATGVDLQALGQVLEESREAMAEGEEVAALQDAPAGDPDGAGSLPAPSAKDDDKYLQQYGRGLSRSTQRAFWIHAPGETAERDGQTLATRHPEVIRAWAEARGGRPATIPTNDPQNPRVLRFDFPEYAKGLQPIEWDVWLRTFQDRNLVFVHQDNKRDGHQSNFFILDSPQREDG